MFSVLSRDNEYQASLLSRENETEVESLLLSFYFVYVSKIICILFLLFVQLFLVFCVLIFAVQWNTKREEGRREKAERKREREVIFFKFYEENKYYL